ncbi:MAG: hypothetical protein RDU89_01715 [bacterium]|nr:hypothetical protein [bacterium]
MEPAAPRPRPASVFFRRLALFLLILVVAGTAAAGAVLLERELRPPPPPAADPDAVRQLEAKLAGLMRAWEGLEIRVAQVEATSPLAVIAGGEPGAETELRLALLEVQARLMKALLEASGGNRGRATRELESVERVLGRAAALPGIPAAWRETLAALGPEVARAQLDLAAGRLSGLDRLELVWHELDGLD